MEVKSKTKEAAVARYKAAYSAARSGGVELIEDYPGRFRIEASNGIIRHLGYQGWRTLDKLSKNLEDQAKMRKAVLDFL